jgi:cysteine desulfurase / selenocysteine lyase
MPPYQGGGEMIKDVSFSKTSYNDLPFKFEAGTPNVGDVLGMEEAVKYINELGINNISLMKLN